jgi:hypothetical protein
MDSSTDASAGPSNAEWVGHPRNTTTAEEKRNSEEKKSYRWREGECLKDYGNSAKKWEAHTSSPKFAAAFTAIQTKYAQDNDVRTKKIEEFLLTEATAAGVVTVTHKKKAKNPNKWAKHFAPWFNTSCHKARTNYREAVKPNGRMHAHTVSRFQ